MKDWTYKEVRRRHWEEQGRLRKQLSQAELAEKAEMAALEQQCLLEHGAHVDDGGFMYGFCKRYGAFLG